MDGGGAGRQTKHESSSSVPSNAAAAAITTTTTAAAATVSLSSPVATTTAAPTTTSVVLTPSTVSGSLPPGLLYAAAQLSIAGPSAAAVAAVAAVATTTTTSSSASTTSSITVLTAATAAGAAPSPAAAAAAASSSSSASSLLTSNAAAATSKGISHRPAVFDKLESLVQDMQDDEHGVPVRSQKLFLTSIPAAFMGYDLIEWLMDRLSIEDSLEAVHLANLLCQFGYYFPVNELKNLLVKDDSSLYRFQTPYYWPSQHHTPDNIEYAIYLAKRSQRNKQKHGLEDYEVEAFNNLKKILTSKWDFVTMQAEEQLKLNKDRKRGDKIITDSQEKAYWRVYRPPPGFTTVVESCPVPTREQRVKARSRTREHLTEELEFLRNYCSMSRCKVSHVAECLMEYTEDFCDFDPVLSGVLPVNPWKEDDQSYWMLNQPVVDCPTERRVRKWAISLEDLISDPLGVVQLMAYMKKEFSHENLRFWLAVQELKTGPGSEVKIKKKVKEIWDEFLSPGAKAEVNIDGKTMEATKSAMKTPTRYTYEVAAEHVYTLLLKKDCYPRFVRSDHYKALLANSINPLNQKKRFPFTFVKKKVSTVQPQGNQGAASGQPGQPNPRSAMEAYNIYGADGTDEMVGEGQDLNSRELTPYRPREPTSICPWDRCASPAREDERSGIRHERASASLSDLPSSHEHGAGSGGGYSPKRQASGHSSRSADNNLQQNELVREPSRSSRSGGREGHHHRRHEHHEHGHHHHDHSHHHGGSRRAKSKSKRKKTPRKSAGIATASATSTGAATSTQQQVVASGPDKENVGISSTAEMLAAGTAALMSTAATSGVGVPGVVTATAAMESTAVQESSTTLSSIAVAPLAPAAAVAVHGLEGGGGAVNVSSLSPLKASVSVDLPSSHSGGVDLPAATSAATSAATIAVGGTISKCTQSKLDERQQQPLQRAATSEGGDPTYVAASTTEEIKVGLKRSVVDSGGGELAAEKLVKPEDLEEKSAGWGSSTEVCPWEDEENRKDSHAPFTKTYATLGYL